MVGELFALGDIKADDLDQAFAGIADQRGAEIVVPPIRGFAEGKRQAHVVSLAHALEGFGLIKLGDR